MFPISDHCDGTRFFNPGAAPRRGGALTILRWRLRGGRTQWPGSVENPRFVAPPKPVEPGMVGVSFIGHATFLLRLGGVTVLTDPIFSERCSPVSWAGPRRVRPPGLTLDELPPIDVVLVSHNHYDHLDLPSLRRLRARDAPLVVTTLGNGRRIGRAGLDRIEELDWWQATRFGALEVTATQARHFSARTLFDRNRALWGGFMLRTGENRVLFAGDSGAGAHWDVIHERLGSPDLALLPIGAYEPRSIMATAHMNPAEAVQAHLALGAKRSIGMHFGTFQLTDEAIDAPLLALEEATRRQGVTAFGTLEFGETRCFPLGLAIAAEPGITGPTNQGQEKRP
ncbi:MAG: MBL fold metallo-hydrolase [Acetobacteraceae bacterium]